MVTSNEKVEPQKPRRLFYVIDLALQKVVIGISGVEGEIPPDARKVAEELLTKTGHSVVLAEGIVFWGPG